MKKLAILLSFATILPSCSTIRPIPRIINTSFADYRSYTQEGFLISPNPYTAEFESLGEINIAVTPAITRDGTSANTDSIYSIIKPCEYEHIPYDELVAIAVKEAKARGADALVNFSITREVISKADRMYGGYIVGYAYNISGYCIKRKYY